MQLEKLLTLDTASDPVKLMLNRIAIFAAKYPEMKRGVFFAGDFPDFSILLRTGRRIPVGRILCYGRIDYERALRELERLGHNGNGASGAG
ncbi:MULTISPECIES: hypothetical protein [Cupriavidus]